MPSSSKAQHNFMAAIAHNPGFAKKVGVPQSVGKDFSNADKGKSFSKGGDMATKMNPGMMAMMAKKKDGMHKMPDGKMMKNSAMNMGGMTKKMAGGGMPMKDGKPSFIGDGKGMMNKGGMTKMATGGFVRQADGVASKGKTKATQIKMKSGGMAC
jgi:hypothetical protein